MKNSHSERPRQNQADEINSIQIRVGSQALAAFESWIDGSLEQLVAQWRHFATPGSGPHGRRNTLPYPSAAGNAELFEVEE